MGSCTHSLFGPFAPLHCTLNMDKRTTISGEKKKGEMGRDNCLSMLREAASSASCISTTECYMRQSSEMASPGHLSVHRNRSGGSSNDVIVNGIGRIWECATQKQQCPGSPIHVVDESPVKSVQWKRHFGRQKFSLPTPWLMVLPVVKRSSCERR